MQSLNIYNNLTYKPKSCSVIFYKIANNKLYLLLIQKNNKYYDIGGIIKNNDYINSMKTYIQNKTNFIINLDNYDININNLIYITSIRHLIQFIEADGYVSSLNKSDFSKYEIEGVNNIIKRDIVWINKDDLKIFNKYNLVDKKLIEPEVLIKMNNLYHKQNINTTLNNIKLKIKKNLFI